MMLPHHKDSPSKCDRVIEESSSYRTHKCPQGKNRGPQARDNAIGVDGVGQPGEYLGTCWLKAKKQSLEKHEILAILDQPIFGNRCSKLTADLWASEKPPTREAPRPQPWRIIPQMMEVMDFSKGNHLQGPARRTLYAAQICHTDT